MGVCASRVKLEWERRRREDGGGKGEKDDGGALFLGAEHNRYPQNPRRFGGRVRVLLEKGIPQRSPPNAGPLGRRLSAGVPHQKGKACMSPFLAFFPSALFGAPTQRNVRSHVVDVHGTSRRSLAYRERRALPRCTKRAVQFRRRRQGECVVMDRDVYPADTVRQPPAAACLRLVNAPFAATWLCDTHRSSGDG